MNPKILRLKRRAVLALFLIASVFPVSGAGPVSSAMVRPSGGSARTGGPEYAGEADGSGEDAERPAGHRKVYVSKRGAAAYSGNGSAAAGAGGRDDGDPAEKETLGSRLSGKYSLQLSEDEYFTLELFEVDGVLYGQGAYCMAENEGGTLLPYSFYALELIPKTEGALKQTDTDTLGADLLQFSVMSNLCRYQGDPQPCRLRLTEDGIFVEGEGTLADPALEGGGGSLFVRDERTEDTFPYTAFFPMAEEETGTAMKMAEKELLLRSLYGCYEGTTAAGCEDAADAEDAADGFYARQVPVYLEFSDEKAEGADGIFQLYQKAPGTEVKLARGSFRLEKDAAGGVRIRAVGSFLGYGTMPEMLYFTPEGEIIRESEQNLVFTKVCGTE